MKKIKYTPIKNNPNIYTDKTSLERELKHTRERAMSTAYDPTPVLFVKVVQPVFSSVAVVNAFDGHTGTVGVNEKREEMAIDFTMLTANALYALGGDQLNISTKGGVDNPHEMKYNNQKAIKRKKALLEPIVDKIPVIVDGNHDGVNGNRLVDSNMSPTAHIADALGLPHAEFSALVQIEMPSSDYARKTQTLNALFLHSSGRSSGPASSVDVTFEKAMNYISEFGIVPDLVVGGHFHSNTSGFIPVEVPMYDKRGKVVGMKTKNVIVISESTLQETSRYGLTAGYPKSDSNVYINDIKFVKNPHYNIHTKDRLFEYQLQLTRIPMFRMGKNEYTIEAKDYMEAYKEPYKFEEYIKAKYGNKEFSESFEAYKNEIVEAKEFDFSEIENGQDGKEL